MCGRFTLRASAVDLTHLFGLAEVPPTEPRYNIAPTQTVFAVRVNEDGKRAPVLLNWGLIPSWATDPKIGYK
jgi:putative SOS response-associated peptidase YedK